LKQEAALQTVQESTFKTVRIPAETWRKVRIRAAINDTGMTDETAFLLEKALEGQDEQARAK